MINDIADSSYLSLLYSGSTLPYPNTNLALTNSAACSTEIQNYSPFALEIYVGKTLIEKLPPYSWVIDQFDPKATVTIITPSNLTLVDNGYILSNTLQMKMPKAKGEFQVAINQTTVINNTTALGNIDPSSGIYPASVSWTSVNFINIIKSLAIQNIDKTNGTFVKIGTSNEFYIGYDSSGNQNGGVFQLTDISTQSIQYQGGEIQVIGATT